MWVMFVFLAWVVAATSCLRLCRTAARVGRLSDPAEAERDSTTQLSLYETAFLAGGPRRVVDLALVRMARERRLLLAHTGWVTVAAPEADDALERAVLTAIGPQGQARIPRVREQAAGSAPVLALGEDLARDGLAVPASLHVQLASGVRQVRLAAPVVAVLWLTAVGVAPPGTSGAPVGGWFVLPLLMIGGCLLIARIEIHPHTRWATVTGQQALARLGIPRRRAAETDPDDSTLLTALAVRGPRALPEPDLRAALENRARD
ncbi:TIGR04222 domain-containing membrane protein [Streptomyces polyrhachis]|uniref:TIGR04222 domain-containing membrane protein n=1 Tax=Streptomyces polyrhachis TaxID=1282885 RepID=A0ABW2GHT0_9ACTN